MFRVQRWLIATMSMFTLAAAATAIVGAAPAVAADLPAFACTDRSGGTSGVTGTVTSIRVAHHDGYDRLVFGFATSLAVPQYELHRQGTSTFTRDASGLPVMLDGSTGFRTVLRDSDIADGVPSDLKPALPEIREVANIGNFERVVSYGVGLRDAACFRAFELSGPSRLVIDVQTPPDSSPNSASGNTLAGAEAAAGQASQPSNLAATGHASGPVGGGPAGVLPVAAALLGLLAAVGGVVAARRRYLARR